MVASLAKETVERGIDVWLELREAGDDERRRTRSTCCCDGSRAGG